MENLMIQKIRAIKLTVKIQPSQACLDFFYVTKYKIKLNLTL